MDHIDIEVGPLESHIFIYTDDGKLLELRTSAPAGDGVVEAMKSRPPASIFLSGDSSADFVRALEALGHEVTLTTGL
jgi:hypothetical protein